MLKFLNAFTVVLILCIPLTSCERVQQIVEPVPVDTQMMPDPIMDEILMAYQSWRYAQPLPALRHSQRRKIAGAHTALGNALSISTASTINSFTLSLQL